MECIAVGQVYRFGEKHFAHGDAIVVSAGMSGPLQENIEMGMKMRSMDCAIVVAAALPVRTAWNRTALK